MFWLGFGVGFLFCILVVIVWGACIAAGRDNGE